MNSRPEVWLDALEYGGRVLRGGADVWESPAAFAAMLGQLMGLLKPDVLVVPVAGFWGKVERGGGVFDRCDRVRDAVGGSGGVPLAAFFRAIDAGLMRRIVISLPGPTAILEALMVKPSADDLDECAILLTDVVRSLGTPELYALAVTECDLEAADALDPLIGSCQHLGLRLALLGADSANFDICFPSAENAILPSEWWDEPGASPAVSLTCTRLYSAVPVEALPEAVLLKAQLLFVNS